MSRRHPSSVPSPVCAMAGCHLLCPLSAHYLILQPQQDALPKEPSAPATPFLRVPEGSAYLLSWALATAV